MPLHIDLEAATRHRTALAEAGRRLASAGFGERMVCTWFGVPVVSDARHVRGATELSSRSRRGLGGWIALLVGGETVEAQRLGVLGEGELEALTAIGWLRRDGEALTARVSLVPVRGVLVAADRLDDRSSLAVGSPDVSAWNLAASLPRAASLLDVGTGAGTAALLAARGGARVVGTDIDPRALAFARVNALLNGVEATWLEGDLFCDVVGRFEAVAFNAPLARAEMAQSVGATVAPLYLASPRGEGLIIDFLAGARARVSDGGEALLHAQLTPAVDQAAAAAGFARRLEVHFASAPDGTPHALVALREGGPPASARVRVPLGPACPHLGREVIDRLHETVALVASRFLRPQALRAATLRPAPWLELTRSAVHDGGVFRPREVRFGAHRLDGEELALIESCDGRTVGELAPGEALLERVASLAERGLLVV
ncbi:MAG: methyltransferase domain-containing protein [Myxococcales bacterium]|nr:methyltransferase domain-containing protein [Myxococcales bacterium]